MTFLNTLVMVDIPNSEIRSLRNLKMPFIVLNEVRYEYFNNHPYINFLDQTD